jgi:hypothetical protein
MAFRPERRDAKEKLEKYPISNLETVLEQAPASERKLAAGRKRTRKSLPYKACEYKLRSKCDQDTLPWSRDDEQDDPNASGSPAKPNVSSSRKIQAKPSSQQKGRGGNSSKQASSSQSTQRQNCTQKCSLAIVRGSRLDENLPRCAAASQSWWEGCR